MISKSPNDDGSKKRRMSHSPVSVNTTYELSEHNTDKLWENFQSNIKRRSGSRGGNSFLDTQSRGYSSGTLKPMMNFK